MIKVGYVNNAYDQTTTCILERRSICVS